MEDRLLKTYMNILLNTSHFDEAQKSILSKYKNNKHFRRLLSQKAYNEIPFTLDYFTLIELRIKNLKERNTLRQCKKTAFTAFLENNLSEIMNNLFLKVLNENNKTTEDANLILNCFEENNTWSQKLIPESGKALTTKNDIGIIYKLCKQLAKTSQDADKIFVSFFQYLIKAKNILKNTCIDNDITLEQKLEQLPDNWYQEPWYYLYVQYFGTDHELKGTFDTLKKELEYLEHLGIYNIYILPHYESPQGDAGYDISAYIPSNQLGGHVQYQNFLVEANKRGFRVATDLVFNHTSVDHKWFQKAINGHPKYFDYYLKCPANWEKLDINEILKDENGDLFLYLKEINSVAEEVISKRILIFPDVSKTHWLSKKIDVLDKNVLFYREFYPFQVDLDLQNPAVINELFKLISSELSTGLLGKRTDAIAHWIKEPGTEAKNLPQTYALQKLIKQFIIHISPKAIILPEVVTSSTKLKEYAGKPITINNKKTTSSGDALLDFELQGLLREMLYFQKTVPFWKKVEIEQNRSKENTSVQLLPIEHHDETYMGFIDEIEAMREYITGNNISGPEHKINRGIVYKNGMSAGARYSNCLNKDSARIANAFFCLYMMPATPVIYYGTEIGEENNYTQFEKRKYEQFETFQQLLGPENPITLKDCEDPRELQRGPIKAQKLWQAVNNNYPTIEIIKQLNRLRKKYSALQSYLFDNLDDGNLDIGILAMARLPENNDDNRFMAVSNLTELPKNFYFGKDFLINKLKSSNIKSLKSIFSLKSFGPNNTQVLLSEETIYENDNYFHISLNPYSNCLFLVEE